MIQVIVKMYKNMVLSIIAKYMDNARQGVNAVALLQQIAKEIDMLP